MQQSITSITWGVVLWAAWAAQTAAGDSQCSLLPQHHILMQTKGSGGTCVTHCLMDQLGQPETAAERLLAYLTAVSEYCGALNSNLSLCQNEPLCQVMLLSGNASVQVGHDPARATAADWWQALTKDTHQECWPDWLRIFNEECPGSRHAQIKQCLLGPNLPLTAQEHAVPAGHGVCPPGCMLVFVERPSLLRSESACLPPWVLHEVCGNKSCGATDAAKESPHCTMEEAFLKNDDAVRAASKSCNVAVAYARATTIADFQGSCPHRVAVALLSRAVPKVFTGPPSGRCSVKEWVSEDPGIDPWVAEARFCDMWPQEAPVEMLHLRQDQSYQDSMFREFGNDAFDLLKPRTLTEAALMLCASGYQHMHASLSMLWRSRELYNGLLEGWSSWRRSLPRAGQVCHELCVENSTRAGAEKAELAWGALEQALQVFCANALEEASISTDVTQLGCAEELRNLKHNWLQHQLLATVWLMYVSGLVSGLLALYVLWHWPQHCLRVLPGACGVRHRRGLVSSVNTMPPRYHGTNQTMYHSQRTSVVVQVLNIMRACWFVADIVMDITVVVLLKGVNFNTALATLPPLVTEVLDWCATWLIVVMCAQLGVAMLLLGPNAYLATETASTTMKRNFKDTFTVVLWFITRWVMCPIMILAGVWWTVVASIAMLIVLCCLPEVTPLKRGPNILAYTTLLYMCQGVVQALPAALVSTAAIEVLLVADAAHYTHILWGSLLLSMSRFAAEVFNIAVLTHLLHAPCFVTAIVDIVNHSHLLPPSQRARQAQVLRDDLATQAISDGDAPPHPVTGLEASNPGPASRDHAECATSGGVPAGPRCHGPRYLKYLTVYVSVVLLLAATFLCLVCSHIIWPWFRPGFAGLVPAASARPYSLLSLWGNYRLSGSVKGSLAALNRCHLAGITCNLTAT